MDSNGFDSQWAPPGGQPAGADVPQLPSQEAPRLPSQAQAQAQPQPQAPVAPPVHAASAYSPPDHMAMTLEAESAPPNPRASRSKAAVGGAVAGVLALGAAGIFAAGQLTGGNDGGAESPEAVGVALMASIEQEDVLGMVDLLLPGERETFREPMIEIVGELSRLEILSADASLADLAGFDFELQNEVVDVRPTNASDISNITMSADMTATLDGAALPIGPFVTDQLPDDMDMSEIDETDTTPFDLPMTVVERDGRWYLSVFYTAAESARAEMASDPIPTVGVEPRGGDTPEGALDALFDGVEQLDLAKIIGAINPNEAEALQRYAPLFLNQAQPLLDEVPLSWQVTNTAYTVEGNGSKRFVTIDSLQIDGVAEGETFSLALDAGCVTIEGAGESINTCEMQDEALEGFDLDELLADAEPIRDLVDDVQAAFADYEQPGLTVQEVDGQWYISPIGSGFDQLLAVLNALDRQELDTIAEGIEESVAFVTDEFDNLLGDVLGGGFFGNDMTQFDDFSSNEPLVEPAVDDLSFDDSGYDDSGYDDEQSLVLSCYDKGALADVTSCLQENIDSGALPEYYMSLELQYPECGVGEVSLGTVPLAAFTDEEYTALVTVASECFAGLVDAGAILEYEVPSDYVDPACAEGQNPWQFETEEDNELFDRWLDCIYS